MIDSPKYQNLWPLQAQKKKFERFGQGFLMVIGKPTKEKVNWMNKKKLPA